jgi:hypothetical protein
VRKLTCGPFEIEVEDGGYPVWCALFFDGKEIARFHHSEIRCLHFLADAGMRDARTILRRQRAGAEDEV